MPKQKIKPVVLLVLDGVGAASKGGGNAVSLASTPNLDKFWSQYPHTNLEAAGLSVGLPPGTDGNSEVGHMALGAGKVIFQNLPRIDNAIQDGSFDKNPHLLRAFEHAKKHQSSVHIMSLLGTGYVHASQNHLEAVLEMASRQSYDKHKVFLHLFMDGRDSAPDAGVALLERLSIFMRQKKVGVFSTLVGRTYAMDRNRNWQKTKVAYDLLTQGLGTQTRNLIGSLKVQYAQGKSDEYIEPLLLIDHEGQTYVVKDRDAVIFVNFRPDRAVQLTMAFEALRFPHFNRVKLNNLYFVGMCDYENGYPKIKAFPPEKITMPLGKVLSQHKLRQLRVAESEKYPHVTYFFNGAHKAPFPLEKRIEVPSPSGVATYDLAPQMSQQEVTNIVLKQLQSGRYHFILVNFAAPDMVAHSGNIKATVAAMENCDACVGSIVAATLNLGGMIFVTADHGNAEEMLDLRLGEKNTKHSTNPVQFMFIRQGEVNRELGLGGLIDVAPTILTVMGLPVPSEMTGRNLLS